MIDYVIDEHLTYWKECAKCMNNEEILSTIRHCRESAQKVHQINPNLQTFYLNQASCYAHELIARKRNCAGSATVHEVTSKL
jgi:hypothetical protein